MNDRELRELVRDAVARHIGGRTEAPPPAAPAATVVLSAHPSQGLYISLMNTTDDCIIEPSVKCEHCGYCKTHGH